MTGFTLLKGTLIDTTSTDDIINTSQVSGDNVTDTINNLDDSVVHKAGVETITGSKTFTATTTFQGDVIQQGTTYTTHAEQVYTTKDTIIMRDGALTGLADGVYSGLTAKLYDGVNDGQLVFDNKGVARVGDIGSLQPIATREETPTNGYYAKWSFANQRFETDYITTNEVGNDSTITGSTVTDALNNIVNGTAVFDVITLDTTPVITDPAEGQINWNAEDGTAQIGLPGGNVKLQLGQEHVIRVKNEEAFTLTNGTVVYASSSSGNIKYVKRASCDDGINGYRIVGVATEDIAAGSFGYITTIGIVRDVNTDSLPGGAVVYLGVNGAITTTRPVAPNKCIVVGIVVRSHATEGILYTNIQIDSAQVIKDVTKDPTGFYDNDNIIVTGNGDRTVTLTGTVQAYWRGEHVTTLVSGYESPAHGTDTSKIYYLSYNGTSITWSDSIWTFDKLQIAVAYYNPTAAQWFYLKETHGVMPYTTHSELHETLGTYLQSGGSMSGYTLSSTTAANRRPDVAASYVRDEDLVTLLPALTSKQYTQYYLSSTATQNFALSAADIVHLSGNNPYWNQFSGGNWIQTLMQNKSYMSIWLYAIPACADATSQAYRYIWVQGQANNTSLTNELALQPSNLNLGSLSLPEIVCIGRVIIQYTAANWNLNSVQLITGTKLSQTATAAGNFLTAVTTDATLTGSGTPTNPLSVTQSYVTLTGDQTIAGTKTFSSTITGSISGNAGTATKLATARNISLTGDVTGSTSFDGSADASITATVADNSHNHTSSNISDATNLNTASMIVKRDASGNFSAGTITASLSGNSTTATTATNVSSGTVSCTTFTSSSTNTFNGLTATTVPYLNASKQLTSSSVTPTELGYLSGVTSAIQTQLNGKQATLVSGTNIKTVNSNSLLGSGDVSVGTVTSVAAGNGMNFTTITSSGSVIMGTPSSVTNTSTNSVTTNSHTHAVSGLTTSNLSAIAGITNAQLANSAVTIGTTSISLGASSTTLTGLSSVGATTFTGALSGNASTATTLATARTIDVSGMATGTATSFNGSANISIPITTIQSASASQIGVVDTAAQTFAGVKTFSSIPTITGTYNTSYSQPLRHFGKYFFRENDFLPVSFSSLNIYADTILNKGAALSSGTSVNMDSTPTLSSSHIGVKSIASSTSANSGFYYSTSVSSFMTLGGYEIADFVFQLVTSTNTIGRFGFVDSTTASSPTTAVTDGAYFEISGTTLSGKVTNSSATTTAGTTYTLSTGTWYRARIITGTATTTFKLYNESGTELLSTTATRALPSVVITYGFAFYNTGTTSVTLAYIDYASLSIERELIR